MPRRSHAHFAALLIAMAGSAPSRSWSADEARGSVEPDQEGAAQPASGEEFWLEDPSGTASEDSPLEAPPSNSSAADLPAGEQRVELPRRIAEPALASPAIPATAPAQTSGTPVRQEPLESPIEFSRRIQQARQLAAKQRKTRTLEVVPDGLSREELEIRAAERNVAIYDKQIAAGQGTPAIEAYRK